VAWTTRAGADGAAVRCKVEMKGGGGPLRAALDFGWAGAAAGRGRNVFGGEFFMGHGRAACWADGGGGGVLGLMKPRGAAAGFI